MKPKLGRRGRNRRPLGEPLSLESQGSKNATGIRIMGERIVYDRRGRRRYSNERAGVMILLPSANRSPELITAQEEPHRCGWAHWDERGVETLRSIIVENGRHRCRKELGALIEQCQCLSAARPSTSSVFLVMASPDKFPPHPLRPLHPHRPPHRR